MHRARGAGFKRRFGAVNAVAVAEKARTGDPGL
jgi:hypothetical protein